MLLELEGDERTSCLKEDKAYTRLFPRKRGEGCCFQLQKKGTKFSVETSYYIGVDWLEENHLAIMVEPKLNVTNTTQKEIVEVDYLKMLLDALKNKVSDKEINDLFIIDWRTSPISIPQKQDFLTPLLIIEFLSILKAIVRKGLKRSYYKVEYNLKNKVKGKMLVAQNIKKNLPKNKSLYNYCSYEELGLNNTENRLLKRTLKFVKKYLSTEVNAHHLVELYDTLNYITPAFTTVSDEIELNEIKHNKVNAFYQEYNEALKLAKIILKRFGYNITNIMATNNIQTPPFWIDMSKLFELYVLSKLRASFGNDIEYHFSTHGNELDYLLNSKSTKMIIDAKYIPRWKDHSNHKNVRQLSGYGRLKTVYNKLNMPYSKIIDCLIIYPDIRSTQEAILEEDLTANSLNEYVNFYKHGVSIPLLK